MKLTEVGPETYGGGSKRYEIGMVFMRAICDLK